MKTSRILLALVLLCAAPVVHAAKVRVSWVNPTTNTDGSVLTDLSHIIVEWGTCNGTSFGTARGNTRVNAPATTTFMYPTGVNRACFRAFAVNGAGVSSVASNTAFKDLLPAPGKPVTLGQPVVLPNSQQE